MTKAWGQHKEIFNRVSGGAQNEKGKASEEAVKRAFREALTSGLAPEWVKNFRVGSPEDNRKHIDAWVETTDVGSIAIQVKSSRRQLEESRAKLGKRAEEIAFVCVNYSNPPKVIFELCLREIKSLRERYLCERRNF